MAYFSQISVERSETIKQSDGSYKKVTLAGTVQFQPFEVPMAIPEMSISFDEASRRIALMLDSSIAEQTEKEPMNFRTLGGKK